MRPCILRALCRSTACRLNSSAQDGCPFCAQPGRSADQLCFPKPDVDTARCQLLVCAPIADSQLAAARVRDAPDNGPSTQHYVSPHAGARLDARLLQWREERSGRSREKPRSDTPQLGSKISPRVVRSWIGLQSRTKYIAPDLSGQQCFAAAPLTFLCRTFGRAWKMPASRLLEDARAARVR